MTKMNTKYKFLILIITIVIVIKSFQYYSFIHEENDEELNSSVSINRVKVSVYYEALCPDSKFFVIYLLLPIYEKMKEYTTVDLVPYGKAKTIDIDGKITFHCQHDAVECTANKVHACVIHYVKDSSIQLKYIACMIADNMIPDDACEKCGREYNIDSTTILECAYGDLGTQLLKTHGERTHSLSPPVRFIPTIELNGSQNIVPQSTILKDLLKSICQVLPRKPKECYS